MACATSPWATNPLQRSLVALALPWVLRAPSPRQGKPSLSALAGFCAQQKRLHQRRWEGPRLLHAEGNLTALISLSHRTQGFQIKVKSVWKETQQLGALSSLSGISGIGIPSTYSQPYTDTALLPLNTRAHSVKCQLSPNKLKHPWKVIVLLCNFLCKS